MTVKRYDCTSGGAKFCQGCYTMTENELGDYVASEEYDAPLSLIAEMLEALESAIALIRHGSFAEGHCLCGSPVDGHGIGDGHSPVDAGEYYAGQVAANSVAIIARARQA